MTPIVRENETNRREKYQSEQKQQQREDNSNLYAILKLLEQSEKS